MRETLVGKYNSVDNYLEVISIESLKILDEVAYAGRVGILKNKVIEKENIEFTVDIDESLGYEMYLQEVDEFARLTMSSNMWAIVSRYI